MSIDGLEQEIIKIASRFHYIKNVITLLKTSNTIKVKLEIAPSTYIQIYHNIKKNVVSYVLVIGNSRIYGRDCDGGFWHRHPVKDSGSHDFSAEGSKEITLDEFLIEVGFILIRFGIIGKG